MKDRIMNTEKLIALVKAQQTDAAYIKKCIKRIKAAEKAVPAKYIRADLTFTRARATCNLWTKQGYYKGYAGGYGYDRASAALSEAAKKSPEIDRLLFDTIEGHEDAYKNILGYGCGYGPLPYLEGGVGLSCLFRIFNRCGLVGKHIANDKTDTLILMTPDEWKDDFAYQIRSI